jgi:hypothetical protein
MGELRRQQSLSREQFRELQPGGHLLDRQGRVWTVRAAPFIQDGEHRVVLQAGDLVLVEKERFADSYSPVEEQA